MSGAQGKQTDGKDASALKEIGARERLLRVAAEFFARKGYAATSVNEIVEAAGVTKPVLYYYFRKKEGIYHELMSEAARQFAETLKNAEPGPGDPIARLTRLCELVFVLFLENIPTARVMFSIYYGPPQGAPYFDFEVFHSPFQKAIRQLVEEGIRSGEFRAGDPDDMTWAVLGAINICMELELCHPEIAPGRTGLVRILDLVYQGLAAHRTA